MSVPDTQKKSQRHEHLIIMSNYKIYSLTSNGLEEKKVKPDLPLYSRVYGFGIGMFESVYAVISKSSENGTQQIVCMSKHMPEYISQQIDRYSRPISKKFGIGLYWDDIEPDFRFDKEQIDIAISRQKEFLQKKEKERKLKELQDEKEQKELPQKYPHLNVLDNIYDRKALKKNFVADLKKNFPGHKFSIRTDYCTVYVSWKGDLSLSEVRKITDKWESYVTDCSGDFRDYCPTNFNKVFGGYKYIFIKKINE